MADSRVNILRELSVWRNPLMKWLSRVVPVMWCALVLVGCNRPNRTILFTYRHTPQCSWDRQQDIVFHLDSVPRSGVCSVSVAVRTVSWVPFQRISVVVEQSYVHPRFHRTDTVSVRLSDEHGNIEGNGMVLYNYLAPIASPVRLRRGQRGEIRVRHIMRRMQIDGISEVGIKVERIE